MKSIKIDEIEISNESKICFFAGLNILETSELAKEVAFNLKGITEKLGNPFVFKASFDKANRSSVNSYRGPGLDNALEIFKELKKENIKIISDVHEINHISLFQDCIDIIQIPAFLCRQTDLLISAAKTNKVINIKKGQFLAPWDMKNVINKIVGSGNKQILLTERGSSFGYNALVNDMRSLPIMKETGYPVIYDATHSVQFPGGMGDKSGGQREFIVPLSKAAVAIGVAGIFVETHEDPDNAPSDGANMLKISDLDNYIQELIKIDKLIKN